MQSEHFKKILSTVLILSIVLPSSFFLIPPKKADAQFAVTDPGLYVILQGEIIPILTGVAPGQAQKEGGLFGLGYDGVAYFAARILVRQLTQSIVDWINNGFEGNPSFVQDPQKFLEDTADRTVGEFIFASDLQFLCKPFEINIRLALGLQYSPFKDRINCKLSDVLQNVDGAVTDAYNSFVSGDFIAGGGWDSWLQITTVPQNNQLGALLIAQSELDANIANKIDLDQNKLNWSGGILSYQECTEVTVYKDPTKPPTVTKYKGDSSTHPNGVTTSEKVRALEAEAGGGPEIYGSSSTNCKIVTPGSLISDQMKQVTGLDTQALNMADEINEIVGALANFLVTKVMEKGLANVTTEELSADDSAWRQGIESLKTQQYQSYQSSSASDISYMPASGSPYGSGSNPNGNPAGDPKQNLEDIINLVIDQEQYYFDNYNAVYLAASDMETKFSNNVVACYNTKINSGTLTSAEVTTANNQINLVTTTYTTSQTATTSMTYIKNSLFSGLTTAQDNINKLNNALDALAVSTTLDQVAYIQSALTAPGYLSLHTSDEVTASQANAASILSYINSVIPIESQMETSCNAL